MSRRPPSPNPSTRRTSTTSLRPSFPFSKRRSSSTSISSSVSAPPSSSPSAVSTVPMPIKPGFHPLCPLPTPVRPDSLAMPAPPLGNARLPRPRSGSGAPPVDINAIRVAPPIQEQLNVSTKTKPKTVPPAPPSSPASPTGSPSFASRVKDFMLGSAHGRRTSSTSSCSSGTGSAFSASTSSTFSASSVENGQSADAGKLSRSRSMSVSHPGVRPEWF
ncbi:hypothetical protein HMN09_01014500 [Mycena chlorophos]|uniref:Uncharacterized protein n=1 Tax=Mycena chlorophos TaxID=658473 RepID=A0A8H6SFH0_MYCCL|nr:hypothetical protein HMN09_01014500 [Mycena chlorophos]